MNADQLRETAVQFQAMRDLLIDKGIIDQQEWDRYRAKAAHKIDQREAEIREDTEYMFDEAIGEVIDITDEMRRFMGRHDH